MRKGQACVVDIRTSDNPYDVYWDYGWGFAEVAKFIAPEWEYAFGIILPSPF